MQLTNEESREYAALSAQVASGNDLGERRERFNELVMKIITVQPSQCRRYRARLEPRDLDDPHLLVVREVTEPLGSSTIDGIERNLSIPHSWMTSAEISAWYAAHRMKILARRPALTSWAESQRRVISDPVARAAAVDALVAQQEPQWLHDRKCWAAFHGADCFDVWKIGRALGWPFETPRGTLAGAFVGGGDFDDFGLLSRFVRMNDAPLVLGLYFVEQNRARLANVAGLAFATVDTPLSPMATTLLKAATRIANDAGLSFEQDVYPRWSRLMRDKVPGAAFDADARLAAATPANPAPSFVETARPVHDDDDELPADARDDAEAAQ